MGAEAKKKFHPGFIKNARNVGIIVGVAIAVVVVAVLAMRSRHKKGPTVDVPAIDMRGGTQTVESERYGQVLNKTNKEGFKQAAQAGGTFIPALSDKNATSTTNLEQEMQKRADAEPEKRIDYAHPNNVNSTGQQAGQAQAQPAPVQASTTLQAQLERLALVWSPNSQSTLGLSQEKNQPAQANVVAGQGQGIAQNSVTTSTGQQNQANVVGKPYISSMDVLSANLVSGIDTDVVMSDVIAGIDSGKYAGAKFMGTAKLVNELVDIQFTMMRLPPAMGGKTIKVNAVAITESEMRTGLNAQIDHRYGQRVGIPMLLGAMGAAGTLYANSGSTVQQTPLGGVTTATNPNPGTKQIMGAAVSGGLQSIQQVIQQETSTIPPRRGTINRNMPIGILFKEDVVMQ